MAWVRETPPVSRGFTADHGRTTSIVEYQPSSSTAARVSTRAATVASTSAGARAAPSTLALVVEDVPDDAAEDAAEESVAVTETIVPAGPRPRPDARTAPTPA